MSDAVLCETSHPHDAAPPRELRPDQFAALAAAAARPVLAPLLLPGTLALVQGPRGIGLSQVMAGCAVAIASGGSFLGWRAPEPQRVLLIAGGEPVEPLARRVGVARRAAGDAETGDRLALVALGPEAALMPNLALRPGQLDFQTMCRGFPVVIIDDLASLLPLGGLECADGGEMRHVIGGLRRDGKALVVAQANGLQARRRADITGRAMVNGLADVVVDLAWPPDYAVTDGCRFELRIARARHLAGAERMPIEARFATTGDGTPLWTVTSLAAGRREHFKAMLADGVPFKDARDVLDVPIASAYRWRREHDDARERQMMLEIRRRQKEADLDR